MPTPETVPFRLTRDIVDGMGVPGVEGGFRRCCEKTMAVMHANHEALLTILQVWDKSSRMTRARVLLSFGPGVEGYI